MEDPPATVLAFANGIDGAVVLSSRVKSEVLRRLRIEGKSREMATIVLFAAGLFLLLEEYLDQLGSVTIDVEYMGHEATIKSLLLRHIWRKMPSFEPERIVFDRVGKKSPAHRKAEAVRTGKDSRYRSVTLREVLLLLE